MVEGTRRHDVSILRTRHGCLCLKLSVSCRRSEHEAWVTTEVEAPSPWCSPLAGINPHHNTSIHQKFSMFVTKLKLPQGTSYIWLGEQNHLCINLISVRFSLPERDGRERFNLREFQMLHHQ